jgi:signal transduction histidine kinase
VRIPLIAFIAAGMQLVPVAVALARPRWLRGPRLGVAIWLVLLALMDVSGLAWTFWLKLGNNHAITYIFAPVQGAVLLWAISLWQVRPVLRTTVRLLIPLLLAWWAANIALIENLDSFSVVGSPVYHLIALSAALLALVTRARDAEEPLLRADWLWILVGIALFFAANASVTIVQGVAIEAMDYPLAARAGVLKSIIDVVALLVMTGGFLWPPRPTSSGALTVLLVVVAFVAALVIAQRDRIALRREGEAQVARAQEEERAWVAGELHDDILQRIALLRHEMEQCLTGEAAAADPATVTRLRGINAELLDLGVAVRNIARRLHPTVVDQIGLLPAVQALADETRGASGIAVSLRLPGEAPPVGRDVARAAYRIIQEALRNTARHSRSATATVEVRIQGARLHLRVADEGRGFGEQRPGTPGIGLGILRERALSVGGTAEVESDPARGTVVTAVLPLRREGE